jgi:hypothetical protein
VAEQGVEIDDPEERVNDTAVADVEVTSSRSRRGIMFLVILP